MNILERFALTAILLIIATACSTDDDANKDVSAVSRFNFGQSIEVKSNSLARVAFFSGIQSIDIQVTSIGDSRCPSDVVCIWEGEANVTFKINGIDQPVTLCTWNRSYCNNPYEFTVDKVHYKLTLKDVIPYPTTTNGNEERKAKFVVEVI
ncbi:MAG TPA: hypothetical protein VL443_19410 [Cyclobacteriaceae bacterium]|jgi:hypothetical protein|nr:hypothetical protein [Cyclobacteriaceae bacterium]